MKRKAFRAFTLVELIVVIAIFGIIMTGLMNFFTPIRQTYVDSTLYEKQRTTQNGIIEYLCESTRYAEKMAIFDQGATKDNKGVSLSSADSGITGIASINNVNDAINAFCQIYNADSITDPDEKQDFMRRIRVVCINRSDTYSKTGEWTKNGRTYRGRIITNVDDNTVGTSPSASDYGHYLVDDTFKDEAGERTKGGALETSLHSYMALGGSYYGEFDYGIYIDYDKTFPGDSYDGGITFGVLSQLEDNGNVVKNGNTNGNSEFELAGNGIALKTVQGNYTRNLNSDSVRYFISDKNAINGAPSPLGVVDGKIKLNNPNKNTYIIFTIPDEKDR